MLRTQRSRLVSANLSVDDCGSPTPGILQARGDDTPYGTGMLCDNLSSLAVTRL